MTSTETSSDSNRGFGIDCCDFVDLPVAMSFWPGTERTRESEKPRAASVPSGRRSVVIVVASIAISFYKPSSSTERVVGCCRSPHSREPHPDVRMDRLALLDSWIQRISFVLVPCRGAAGRHHLTCYEMSLAIPKATPAARLPTRAVCHALLNFETPVK